MNWLIQPWHCKSGTALVLLILAVGCKKEPASLLPGVTTKEITYTSNYAVGGGRIVTEGSSPVTSHGVCYNSVPGPTVNNERTRDTKAPDFTSTINGLQQNTVYYVRAYATTNDGTVYGNEVSFTAPPGSITIGAQTWMAQNLDVSTYRNGDPILNVTLESEWSSLITSAYSDYNNSVSPKDMYGNSVFNGRLYNWYAVTDSRNLCPAGWHVPTDDEWTILTDYLGGLVLAGGKLKEAGAFHWQGDNVVAANESGFRALPGGVRYNNGGFANLGTAGYWWTGSATSASNAQYRLLKNSTLAVATGDVAKGLGCSVRCIKD